MRQRKRVQHICATCGQIRYLQPSDAAKTKHCQRCRTAPAQAQASKIFSWNCSLKMPEDGNCKRDR